MPQREQAVQIRPFKKDAYGELSLEAERGPPISLRKYERGAYDELRIRKEELVKNVADYVALASSDVKFTLDRATHYSGIVLISIITLACLWIMITSSDHSQLDTATKLIFTISGAIIGVVFHRGGNGNRPVS